MNIILSERRKSHRVYTILFHFHEIFQVHKSVGTGRRLVVAGVEGRGKVEVTANGHERAL